MLYANLLAYSNNIKDVIYHILDCDFGGNLK